MWSSPISKHSLTGWFKTNIQTVNFSKGSMTNVNWIGFTLYWENGTKVTFYSEYGINGKHLPKYYPTINIINLIYSDI